VARSCVVAEVVSSPQPATVIKRTATSARTIYSAQPASQAANWVLQAPPFPTAV
jgi:hypothetical protein